MAHDNDDVTGLLRSLRDGSETAWQRLIPLIYEDLRRVAHGAMRRERNGGTLQTTALVHEAFLRLMTQRAARWADKRHFFRIAAESMRRILVDHARARLASKRGGDVTKVPLDDNVMSSWTPNECDRMLWIDAKLAELERVAPRQSQVVQLRFFAGLSEEEIADVLQVSTKTVKRDWKSARAWLASELSPDRQRAD